MSSLDPIPSQSGTATWERYQVNLHVTAWEGFNPGAEKVGGSFVFQDHIEDGQRSVQSVYCEFRPGGILINFRPNKRPSTE